jgi:hypothetical protein
MSKDNVIAIKKPDTFVDDPISEILTSRSQKPVGPGVGD